MMDCHDNYMEKAEHPDAAILTQYIDIKQFQIATDHKNLVKHIESTYKCSGVCKKAFFFYSLDVEHGRPLVTCGDEIVNAISPFIIGLGIMIIFTSIFLLIVLVITSIVFLKKKSIIEFDEDKQSENNTTQNQNEINIEIENTEP